MDRPVPLRSLLPVMGDTALPYSTGPAARLLRLLLAVGLLAGLLIVVFGRPAPAGAASQLPTCADGQLGPPIPPDGAPKSTVCVSPVYSDNSKFTPAGAASFPASIRFGQPTLTVSWAPGTFCPTDGSDPSGSKLPCVTNWHFDHGTALTSYPTKYHTSPVVITSYADCPYQPTSCTVGLDWTNADPSATTLFSFTSGLAAVSQHGGAGGGTEYAQLASEAGIPIIGAATAPTAAFTATRVTTVPGQFQFVSDSTDPQGGALSEKWDFGDGTKGEGRVITHTYAKPGTFHATLTVSNPAGETSSVTKDVVVAAPTLAASLSFLDPQGKVIPVQTVSPQPGDTLRVRLTVSASADGVGAVHAITFTGDPLTAAPSASAEVSAPSPTIPANLALDPGASRVFEYAVKVTASGSIRLTSTPKGTDAAGAPVTATPAQTTVNADSHALKVTITPSKNDFKLGKDADGKPKPEIIEVTVTVANTTDKPIDNVVAGPLDLAASDKQHPYEPFPAAVVGANEDVALGTIAPHTSPQFLRKLKISGDGNIDLKELITSSDGVTRGLEHLRVGVTTLLEMVVDGDPTRQVSAGGSFRISGHFTNVSVDRTVALTNPIKVLHEGNVLGGGMLARADGPWLTSDFPPPLIQKLKPGQSVDFQVRFGTARPTPADYDQGTADSAEWTQGSVTFAFSPRAAVQETDGSWSALTAQPVQVNGKYPSSIHLTGAAADRVAIQIDTTQPSSPGSRLVPAGFGFTIGALDGALNKLTDVLGSSVAFTLDPNFRDETIRTAMRNQQLQDALTYLSDFAVYLPNADKQELISTVAQRLHDAYGNFTDTVTGGIPRPDLPGLAVLKAQVDQYLTHLAGAWQRGDPNELIDAVRPLGKVVGESGTDLLVAEATFAGLAALARAPQYLNAAVGAWRDERTIAQMKAKFPDIAQQTLDLKAQELSKSKYPLLENAFTTRRPLTDLELGVGRNKDGAGLSRQTIAKTRQWTAQNPNKTIVIIPNEANVAALRDAQLAVDKIEKIKPKSLATIEYELFGGRAADVNEVILRGDLNHLSSADVDAIVDRGIARGVATEEDRAVAHQIVDKRNKEWASFNNRGAVKKVGGKYVPDLDPATGKIKPDGLGIGDLKAYDEAGRIPNQFRGVENGLTVSGPELAPKFKIEYYDAEHKPVAPEHASYAVPTQESPTTGKLVKITGDDDGVFIGLLNGLGLAPSEINGAYGSVLDVFNHPFSDTWLAKIQKKLEIFSRYFEKIPGTQTEGAPLVMMVNGNAYAVKIDPYLSRFDTDVNRAYLAFVGAPRAVDPIATQQNFFHILLDKVSKFVLPASFLREFLRRPNAATDGAPITTARRAKIVRISTDGQLEAWTP